MTTLFSTITLAISIAGIVLVVFTCIWTWVSAKRKASGRASSIQDGIQEADGAIEELHKTTKAIFEELEEKHQDLLFLYYMIEDRKKEINKETQQEPPIKQRQIYTQIADPKTNPRIGKIRAMHDKGLSEEEIAKSLGIGQGEVKLILNLGKGK